MNVNRSRPSVVFVAPYVAEDISSLQNAVRMRDEKLQEGKFTASKVYAFTVNRDLNAIEVRFEMTSSVLPHQRVPVRLGRWSNQRLDAIRDGSQIFV